MDGTVSNARLLSLTIERFKSYRDATTIDLAPLTVILGRNNSGKSTIIQALLLLKQTLALPRPEVPLHLEGYVDALSLRELTYGWPEAGPEVPGPRISVKWESRVDLRNPVALARHRSAIKRLTAHRLTGLVGDDQDWRVTELTLDYLDFEERTVLRSAEICAYDPGQAAAKFSVRTTRNVLIGEYDIEINQGMGWEPAPAFTVLMDHFLPHVYLFFGSRQTPEGRQKASGWDEAVSALFSGPLEDLKALVVGFSYLGSMRTLPSSLYRPVTVPPEEIGASGEYAAQMLRARRGDQVHYLPPLGVRDDTVEVPTTIRSRPLVEAVNDVLSSLGVETPLRIDDIRDVGFRLLFGKASLQHVGRGLSYLLPLIELGLIADPLRFNPKLEDVPLAEYEAACPHYTHCAFEEGEAHLHPKVQTRLAHWLVALAMARRQLLVETHSDHLVRRLRGLAARAKSGSDLEQWLLANVRILHVEQVDGQSTIKTETLTPQGMLETWPSDFMDEATDEERAIYDAGLDKPARPPEPLPDLGEIEHDVGEEPDLGP